jgi:serine/threonine protein kinase
VIYDNIVKKKMKYSSSISEEVKDLLTKILKINPADRISIAGILAHPWVKKYSSLQKSTEPQRPSFRMSVNSATSS